MNEDHGCCFVDDWDDGCCCCFCSRGGCDVGGGAKERNSDSSDTDIGLAPGKLA